MGRSRLLGMPLPQARNLIPVALAIVAIVVVGSAWGGADAAAVPPGGSNYNWYRVDRLGPGACNREDYGVIANFHKPVAHGQVLDQLAKMIRSGQQRLRIGIFHGRGIASGTVLNSTGGNLALQNRSNLAGLLAAVKQAGFVEVEVAFHPVGPNWAPGWAAWDESLFQENWSVIANLRPIIRGAGLHYRIDLHNEAIPAPSQPVLLEYGRRLWQTYISAFGRDDTVGFSVIGDERDRIARIPEVYGDKPPYLFDMHFYDRGEGNEYVNFVTAHDLLKSLGYSQGWIIGEAYYNDPTAAGHLSAALRDTGRTVFYLTQWPLTRARTCTDVDVSAPTEFDAYVRAGFGMLPPDQGAPPPEGGPPRRLRLRLTKRKLVVDRRGRVTLAVRCGGATTRCSGRVALHVRRRTFRAKPFSIAPEGTARRMIRVTRPIRRKVRRRGRLAATIALRATAVGHPAARRTVRVTLLARRARGAR